MHGNLIQKDLSFLSNSSLSYQVGQTLNKSNELNGDVSLNTIVEPWLLGQAQGLVPLQSLHSYLEECVLHHFTSFLKGLQYILLHIVHKSLHIYEIKQTLNPKPWANPCRGLLLDFLWSSSGLVGRFQFFKSNGIGIRVVSCSDFTKNVNLGSSFLKKLIN
jgi:hypothetical protein